MKNRPEVYRGCFVKSSFFLPVLCLSLFFTDSPLLANDTLAPTSPMNLTAGSIYPYQVNLSWVAATDDTGVTGYKIYRDGQEHAATILNTYNDTDLAPSSNYTYTVAAYDAAGNLSEQSPAYSLTTPIDSTYPLTTCGYLDKANTTYVLQNDVSSAGTCFAVIASNVVLDLNGHTVTYDNGLPIAIANGDFENASGTSVEGWDLSTAPNAQRAVGTFIQPVSVYSGSYAMKFYVPASDQYIRSKAPVTLEPNTTYSLSGMVYNLVSDAATLSIELEGTTVKAARTGKTWRGFQYINARFTTGSTTESRTILVRLAGASGTTAGSVYVDDIKILRHNVAGMVVGPASWRVPNIVSDVSRYGNAPGAIIRNGRIMQGQGVSDSSHAITIEENSGRDYVIRDLEITVHGANSKAVSSFNGFNSKIHDNVIYSNIETITSRDSFDGAAVKIEYPGYGSLYYKNTVNTGIQTGIYAPSKTGEIPNRVYGNTIRLQTKYTNDFAIVSGGSLIYGNTIDCSTGNNSCRGIAGGSNTKIYNNTVSVQELPRNQEYNGCEMYGAYGIQSESGNDVEIYGNTVTAYAGECEAHAFRANPYNDGTTMGQNNYIHDNTFIALASGAARASSVKIGDADATSLDIRNNIMESNRQWLHFDGHAVGLVFTGNTFKTSEPLDSPFYPLTDYNWNKTLYPENITFLDNRYPDSATTALFTSASFRNGSANDPYASYQYAWPMTLQIKDEQGQPAQGASVGIVDKDGNQVFSGVTDSVGNVSTVLIEYKNSGGVKASFNPYTITVSRNAYSMSVTMEIGQPTGVTALVLIDTTPPSISITSPASGSITNAVKTISVDTGDDLGVTKVEYYLNNVLLTTVTASPFSYTWDTTSVADGEYTLSARAYDAAGNVGQSSNVLVTVQNTRTVVEPIAPTVTIKKPTSGSKIGNIFTVSASATSAVGVKMMQVYVDNALRFTSYSRSFTTFMSTYSMAKGSHVILVKAIDNAGTVGQKSITVYR